MQSGQNIFSSESGHIAYEIKEKEVYILIELSMLVLKHWLYFIVDRLGL